MKRKTTTLKDLWESLDKRAQDALFFEISSQLMVGPQTTIAYIRGTRIVPERKRARLDQIVEKSFNRRISYDVR